MNAVYLPTRTQQHGSFELKTKAALLFFLATSFLATSFPSIVGHHKNIFSWSAFNTLNVQATSHPSDATSFLQANKEIGGGLFGLGAIGLHGRNVRRRWASAVDPKTFQARTLGAYPLEAASSTWTTLPWAWPLNRQDAITTELRRRSRTLSKAAIAKTAHSLNASAEHLGYDPLLFLALIHIESDYNHLAISPVGAEGLMQLMPATAAEEAQRAGLSWSKKHSFDPELNVHLGSHYLIKLVRQFGGRMDHALTAYNRGPGNTRIILRRYGSLPTAVADFYSGKVLRRYKRFLKTYGHLPMR